MFAERLKELRLKAGLTQKELAQNFNISQQAYQAWEKGKRNPKKENIQMFADFFHVSEAYLEGKTTLKNETDIDEAKLDEAIDKSLGFNGKPATEAEKESMKEALRIYLESLKK